MRTILSLVCVAFITLAANARKVEWTFDAKDFTAISATNLYVKYTQGNQYSVRVKAEEKYADRLELSVDGNTLVLKLQNDKKSSFSSKDSLDVCVEVVSPVLTNLKCTGVAVFSSGNISVQDKFSVYVYGASKVQLGDLDCHAFSSAVSGAAVMNVGSVKSKGIVSASCNGASNSNIKYIETTDDLSLDCTGASKFHLELKARNIKSTVNGASAVKMEAAAEKAKINVSGAGKLDLGFTGGEMVIGSSGAPTLNLDVDCKMIRATNSGASVFSIAGTTDDIKVECSGASRINTTRLNRF
ncbi:MAG: DUF2807 domain-containing protein [Bacteroides sp.]|nr:DUF2807 domain-containing protein [Roseburia sp.]MCM1347324.1 DUF2807 domain-containing protein [Bacteroides sp.]MCM1421804.1 DUF2807 domain-containing protein [Bacteroides sp.]